jgi:two-component system sensor histidine kinase DesK
MRKSGGRSQSGPPIFFAFIWLIYLIFPIYSMFSMPVDELTISLILLAIFIALYIYSVIKRTYRLASVLLQLVIIGVFCFWLGDNFIYLAFYSSPIMGTMPRKRQTVIAVAALIVLFLSVSWHFKIYEKPDEMIQYVPAMLIMFFMPIGLRLGRRSQELREKLILADEEIARLSKNEERQRISRDLHDTLGHTLSLITLKSELAEKLIAKNPERAVQEVKDIQSTSRAALKQVRELVSGMNAVTIRDELIHARQILAAANIELKVRGDVTTGAASPLADNILGMCLREAITNAVKHSDARTCKVEWIEEPDRLKLLVADDGSGVDMASCTDLSTGNGLRGMKERLKLVEGDLTFDSAKGRGTTITFTLPRVAKSIETGGG